MLFLKVRCKGLAGGKGPRQPLCVSVTACLGLPALRQLQEEPGSPGQDWVCLGHCAVPPTLQALSGPLSPCSASGFQAGHPPWSPNFRSPVHLMRGDFSQPGQVHGEVTEGGSVLSSSLFRKLLKSVGVGVQSPGGSSRPGQMQ